MHNVLLDLNRHIIGIDMTTTKDLDPNLPIIYVDDDLFEFICDRVGTKKYIGDILDCILTIEHADLFEFSTNTPPKSESEILSEEIQRLTNENKQLSKDNVIQDELINVTMMATDEIYMMVEPLLGGATMNINTKDVKERSSMVDMYVAMALRGLKTIEEVPAKYREEVRRIIAELEK